MKRCLGLLTQISNQWPVQKIDKLTSLFPPGHPVEAVLGCAPRNGIHSFSSGRFFESLVQREQEIKKDKTVEKVTKDKLLSQNNNFRSFSSNSSIRRFSVQSGVETQEEKKDRTDTGTEKRKGKSSKAENRVEAPSLVKEVSTMSLIRNQQSDMAASGKVADESDSQPGYWEESEKDKKKGPDSDRREEENKRTKSGSERSFDSISGIADRGYS